MSNNSSGLTSPISGGGGAGLGPERVGSVRKRFSMLKLGRKTSRVSVKGEGNGISGGGGVMMGGGVLEED